MARRQKSTKITRVEMGIVRRDGPQGTSYIATVELPRGADGRRQQRRRTFDTLEDARDWRLRTQHELRAGVYVEPSPRPLGEWIAEWLAIQAGRGLREASVIRYRYALGRFAALSAVLLRDLTAAAIQRQVTALSGCYAANTVTQALMVLKTCLADAVRLGLLPRNPADPVRPPHRDVDPPRPLSPAEVDRLLSATAGDWYGTLWRVALASGLRLGEISVLRWEDVDWTAGALTVRRGLSDTARGPVEREPKTAAGRRVVPLDAATLAVLRAHWRAEAERRQLVPGWNPENYVFTSSRGTRLRQNRVNAALRQACVAAGLAPRTFHDLRHTHGTLLIAAGVDAKTVSQRLGHASVAITLSRYVHPDQAAHRQAAAAFGALIAAAGDNMVTKLGDASPNPASLRASGAE